MSDTARLKFEVRAYCFFCRPQRSNINEVVEEPEDIRYGDTCQFPVYSALISGRYVYEEIS